MVLHIKHSNKSTKRLKKLYRSKVFNKVVLRQKFRQ